MTKSKFSTKYLVEMALLVAIILLMAFTPIGYIKTAGLEITLIVIPVAVGAVTLGPAAGAILGGVFGITSFIQCFGMSAFGTLLLGVNPVFTFLVCVPTVRHDESDSVYRSICRRERCCRGDRMFRYRNSGFHGIEKSTPLLGIINNIMRRNTLGDFMWKCSWKFGSKNVDF